MHDVDSISYEIIFEQLVENQGMSDADFCDKFGYDIETLVLFWSRKIPFDDTEDVEKTKVMARHAAKMYQGKWKQKGYSIIDLLQRASLNIGMHYDWWTSKYWMRFANAVAGNDDLLEGIEDANDSTA